MMNVELVSVFTFEGAGGNPCPVVVNADGMSAAAMQDVARRYGHESGFVLPAADNAHDFAFRYFVPEHEMEMCAHATVGALWLLARAGRLPDSPVRISTESGSVSGFVTSCGEADHRVAITQPTGRVTSVDGEKTEAVLRALGIGSDALADQPLLNAVTSRTKTLVPMRDPDRLHELDPEPAAVEAVCRSLGSSGLYPYAMLDGPRRMFEARQFPRASGYPEDAATGIAAAALGFGLLRNGLIEADDRPICVYQGRAMGRLSEIIVRLGFAGGHPIGCLVGGAVSAGPPSQ